MSFLRSVLSGSRARDDQRIGQNFERLKAKNSPIACCTASSRTRLYRRGRIASLRGRDPHARSTLDRNLSFLSWLLVPVAGALVLSALHLSRQPYTGLTLRGAERRASHAGLPGERAGLAAQDRALAPPGLWRPRPPAAGRARPDARSISSGSAARSAGRRWLVPDRLRGGRAPPDVGAARRRLGVPAARRMGVGAAPGSAHPVVLPPLPDLRAADAADGVEPPRGRGDRRRRARRGQLYLPALFVHFFSHFPESRARAPHRVRVAYGISTALFALSLIPLLSLNSDGRASTWIEDLIQFAGGAWFAFGLFAAFVLFILSFRRAGSADARRRLRVALVGTVLARCAARGGGRDQELLPRHDPPRRAVGGAAHADGAGFVRLGGGGAPRVRFPCGCCARRRRS